MMSEVGCGSRTSDCGKRGPRVASRWHRLGVADCDPLHGTFAFRRLLDRVPERSISPSLTWTLSRAASRSLPTFCQTPISWSGLGGRELRHKEPASSRSAGDHVPALAMSTPPRGIAERKEPEWEGSRQPGTPTPRTCPVLGRGAGGAGADRRWRGRSTGPSSHTDVSSRCTATGLGARRQGPAAVDVAGGMARDRRFREERASMRIWPYRIATHHCLNALRASARRPHEYAA
jgi:hypothetical protein